MSLIDFSKKTETAPTTRTAGGRNRPVDANGNPLPQAKLWLNVGYMAGDRFISLPLGTPIDTMQPRELRGSSQDFLKLVTAQNKLLEGLQGMIETLNPGDEIDLPNLIVKIRRTQGEVAVEGENNYEVDLASLFAGGTVRNPTNERAESEEAVA